MTGHGDPQALNGQRVDPSFFPTLGVLPARGRNFAPEEDAPNGPAVCIISHEMWHTQLGARESIVGESILLNGQPWEVIGVMPPRLAAPFGQVHVFAPRVFEVTGLTVQQVEAGALYAQPIARLKAGVTIEQARDELTAISRGYPRFGGSLGALLARSYARNSRNSCGFCRTSRFVRPHGLRPRWYLKSIHDCRGLE